MTMNGRGALSFVRHDVRALESVSHLVAPHERCGIYVLGFANGEQYVGQSVDVVSRFAAHRRRWADIVSLDWHACTADLLDKREQGVIASKLWAGGKLRNITHARGPLGVSPLDGTVAPDEQLAWLNGGDPFGGDDAERTIDEALQAKKRPAYEQLRADPFFPYAALAFHYFINETIPRPAATERKFWVLTAMPATNRTRGHHRLGTLSINKVEVFWLFSTEFDGERVPWGHLQLSRSLLTERLGTSDFTEALGPEIAETVEFEDDESGYETSGGDGLRASFVGPGWLDLLKNEAVVEAARAFNLMLLRKGTSPLGHHHNYDLAGWVFEPSPGDALGLE